MDLRARAERWMQEDPDPATRAEVAALLEAGDEAGLAERFGPRLEFGTAGIRGPLGAGPARMNRAVVRRVSAGLAARLAAEPGAAERGVVVGRDARHKSDELAEDAARVLAAAGLRVMRFHGVVPTPLVAFAVRHLDAAAGVQVTASHNPPADNGYKVYWSGGAQIVAPLDAEISEAIDAVGSVADVPVAALDDPRLELVGPEVRERYRDALLALQLHPESRDLHIVYTPLHGVAGEVVGDVLAAAGFRDVAVVREQADPDPDFPTVAFPNPEEPGALDLAFALGARSEADLVLANDPDGDRIAVAIPDEDAVSRWRALSGDEIGCLLADYLLTEGPQDDRVVATTVVSSQLLSRIAAAHGVAYTETLTGFKWLAPVAAEAEREGRRFVLAYEQALGAMVGDAVRDKDGISAALVLAEMAAHDKAQGRSLGRRLDDLARRFGLHATAGRSLRLEGTQGQAQVAAILDRLRGEPPEEIGGVTVDAVADHEAGTRRHRDGRTETLSTPPTALLGYTLSDGSRLQVRPSGTEPLLKFYLEVVEPVAAEEAVDAARQRAAGRLSALGDAFLALAQG